HGDVMAEEAESGGASMGGVRPRVRSGAADARVEELEVDDAGRGAARRSRHVLGGGAGRLGRGGAVRKNHVVRSTGGTVPPLLPGGPCRRVAGGWRDAGGGDSGPAEDEHGRS